MVWVGAVLGLVILLVAGECLVRGAVNLSLRLGVPALIVSLTVVAFGTSAPELLISIDAVLDDVPGLALGNVVGSNIANVLLVLGLPALFYSLDTSKSRVRGTWATMMGASVLFVALAFYGPFTWWNGLILLAVLAVILGVQFRKGMKERVNPADLEGAEPGLAGWKIGAYLVVGLAGLPLGANILIGSAVEIAESLGIPDAVIGLTMVAIGTSLPELATTLVAAAKKQADVALGNVIGSNMFNLLAIIGVAALVGDIPVDETFLRLDLWVMLGASLVMAPFVFTSAKMGRLVGVVLCLLYAGYLWRLVVA